MREIKKRFETDVNVFLWLSTCTFVFFFFKLIRDKFFFKTVQNSFILDRVKKQPKKKMLTSKKVMIQKMLRAQVCL